MTLQGLRLPEHSIEPAPANSPQDGKGLVANTRTKNLSI